MTAQTSLDLASETRRLLAGLGVDLDRFAGEDLSVRSPIDGAEVARLRMDPPAEVERKIGLSVTAFEAWRDVPAPRRGELVRLFGQRLRGHKEALGRLVTIENGKILEEGLGEVQEMIDVCDFAVGLSRQLYGLTIASERPWHVMQENWLPLGPVGVISAFNFPVAVWAWNAALAWVCGDPVLWKPSDKTPLTALACQAIFEAALAEFGDAPEGLSHVLTGGRKTVGSALVRDPRVPLVSATGSTRMGREVGAEVARRFGRTILELGGNNAVIVAGSADLSVALPSIVFGAVGTCGQRCTSTRRLIVHRSLVDPVFERLKAVYASIAASRIGNPLDPATLVGPLIDEGAYETMRQALAEARKDALEVWGGERVLQDRYPGGAYVVPVLVRLDRQTEIVRQETFAPILYVMAYETLEEAMEVHNGVPQGLSSSIMTSDVREAETFKRRSDCGIANVNIGTSGAEIGGAFGGEKETGGGRESGSDCWKLYMRRQTSTTYFGHERPVLAQGLRFEAE
jgi:aldehyde dehydrogenase (NAD+)